MIPGWSLGSDPWSLVLCQNSDFSSPPFSWGKLPRIFFVDVFSASLEIDAQDIKVVLLRYHVLQKNHPTRIGVPSRGSCFLWGKHELKKAVVFGAG